MTTYIYESPDGGETVYRRMANSHLRELHYTSEYKKQKLQEQENTALWNDIRYYAKSDSVLKQMLDQIEVYYTLKNIPQDR